MDRFSAVSTQVKQAGSGCGHDLVLVVGLESFLCSHCLVQFLELQYKQVHC